jgi:hypothetical protein
LYDPTAGTWTTTGSLIAARNEHTATLLSNGKVLITGGNNGSTYFSSAEIYDPATSTWASAGASMNTAHDTHTATLLPNGKVLFAGGFNSVGTLATAEIYEVGLGFSSSTQPQINTFTSPLIFGNSLSLAGTQFRGLSSASGSTVFQNSPSDNPVVQIRSLENGQTIFLNATIWSTNFYTSTAVTNLPAGWTLATMFVNGIPSPSVIIPPPATAANQCPARQPDRCAHEQRHAQCLHGGHAALHLPMAPQRLARFRRHK